MGLVRDQGGGRGGERGGEGENGQSMGIYLLQMQETTATGSAVSNDRLTETPVTNQTIITMIRNSHITLAY